MEKITGKNNDIIKGVKKLFSSSKLRREQGLFVLEGARLVFDVLNSFYEVKCFLITEKSFEKYEEKAKQLVDVSEKAYLISNDIADRLSQTQNTQGIFAVCKMKNEDADIDVSRKYIALDNVQDPGNLGTIIRTADALGIDGIITGGGCDVFNPKVLRSSMGSVLRMKIKYCQNLASFLEDLKNKGMAVYGTSPDINAEKITDVTFCGGCVCVIGNEANGISDDVRKACSEIITIPMQGRAESLNASIAAAVVMWEMLR
ncbi:MAG: TrmH family RNA methyltransferase [Eubacterium sp.]